MIRIDKLDFSYERRQIFNQLDFTIKRGEILSLIGPNGCGKSTLLKLLRGQLAASGGHISWDETPVKRMSARTLARKVAVVPQSSQAFFPYTVYELVAMGRYPHRKGLFSGPTADDRQAIQHALAVTDIIALAEAPVTQLSGGELQRVLVARALAQEAEVLFLDEATSHLDIDHRLELSELMVRLNREQGTTIVQVSHDLDLAAAMSQRILLLGSDGRISALGSPAEVMTADNLRRVFRVDVRVEQNPFTGTPQIHPLINRFASDLRGLRVHLICGGGSGTTLLRRLHLANAKVSVGPLNQGDHDENLATALKLPVVSDEPFAPYSERALQEVSDQLDKLDALIVATHWWGPGNLCCLDLAEQALTTGLRVYLLDQDKGQDFTAGAATQKQQQLLAQGALALENEELLLEQLAASNAPTS